MKTKNIVAQLRSARARFNGKISSDTLFAASRMEGGIILFI